MKRTPQGCIQRLVGSGRPVGSLIVLIYDHKDLLIKQVNENTDSVALDGMLEMLTTESRKLEIAKNRLYKFVKENNQNHIQTRPSTIC